MKMWTNKHRSLPYGRERWPPRARGVFSGRSSFLPRVKKLINWLKTSEYIRGTQSLGNCWRRLASFLLPPHLSAVPARASESFPSLSLLE